MSEFEIVDSYMSASALAMTAMALYISIVTGFLITAYAVSTKLSEAQALFLSLLFAVFAGMTIWGTVAYFEFSDNYADRSETLSIVDMRPDGVKPAPIIGTAQILGVIGSLWFMRSRRKNLGNERGTAT